MSFISDTWRRFSDRYDRQDEREFLPAALEVIETPPSPTGRALGLIIILFFAVAVTWSFLGKVDVLATAQGRLLPAGDVKTIQPLDPGVVRAIHVQDGDHVRAGQLLIELDPTQSGADADRSSHDLMQAQLDLARLTALKTAIDTGAAPRLGPVPGASADQIEETNAAMRAQFEGHAAKIADLTQQISQKTAEAGEVQAQIDETNASMPMIAEKERIHRTLTEKGYDTSLAFLDAQQQLSNAKHELLVLSQRATQAVDARAALERERDGAQDEYTTDTLGDLRKAQIQVNEMSQELVKAQDKSTQTALRSPIDGVVDQLMVHTLGGVVSPAQALMIVVPDSQNLTIEARLADRDVGFVHTGQPVKVKVDTFNFTRYGLLDGHVTGISRDVIAQDERQASADPSQPSGRGQAPAYVARIMLDKTSMVIDGQVQPLQPGMAVTAEIKTGDRTIIDYLLSPLARKTQESLHER
jgi:hemolysin D